jgi:hydroxymethylbilane synthase
MITAQDFPGGMLRVGTRDSALALAQTHQVVSHVKAVLPDLAVEVVAMKTTGDKNLAQPFAQVGDKGIFVKELEEGLLVGQIHWAIHSLKDMPSVLPDGLTVTSVLPREDHRDAWVSLRYPMLDAIPSGATVGTASVRRVAQLKTRRPDLNVVPLRGNVQTRFRKLEVGEVDAMVLAAAGLHRLGLSEKIGEYLDPAQGHWTAPCQGILGLEYHRRVSVATQALLATLQHPVTQTAAMVERLFLSQMEGGCQVPLAAYAWQTPSQSWQLFGGIWHEQGGLQASETISWEASPLVDGEAVIAPLVTAMAQRMKAYMARH